MSYTDNKVKVAVVENVQKIFKIIGCILCGVICIVLILLLTLAIRTKLTQNDYSSVYTNSKYEKAIMIDGVEVIEQHISCGYAVIEMFSA